MTDRPTPEQAIADWPTPIHPGSPRAISDHVCHAEVPDIIPALKAAGYVIVHPDDIFEQKQTGGSIIDRAWINGWNDCRHHIFEVLR